MLSLEDTQTCNWLDLPLNFNATDSLENVYTYARTVLVLFWILSPSSHTLSYPTRLSKTHFIKPSQNK